jgi:monoamine oxidase
MPPSCDVVVIGAGAAGLAAARALSAAGRRVVVVEGRTRMGGRILTAHDAEWPLPAELGPEFLRGEAEDARRIVDGAAMGVVEIADAHAWAREGRMTPLREPWTRLLRVRRRFARRGADASVSDTLQRLRIPPAEKRLARMFVEGYYAAPPDRASARWLAAGEDEDAGGFRQYRLAGGYDGVVRWLAHGLHPERAEVRLATAAERVAWRRGRAEVAVRRTFGSDRARIACRAVIVTVPIGVLQAAPGEAAAIRFDPDPASLARARTAILSGAVRKVLLRFREAFWEDAARGVDFLHDDRGAFPTWWTSGPWRAPVLTAWAAGPQADALAGLGDAALVARALDGLAGMMGVPRRAVADRLQAWKTHDWSADPWSRGGYAAVATGGTAAQRALARPVDDTLFFAGEATEPEETGTVSGALASGARAARQALRVLG